MPTSTMHTESGSAVATTNILRQPINSSTTMTTPTVPMPRFISNVSIRSLMCSLCENKILAWTSAEYVELNLAIDASNSVDQRSICSLSLANTPSTIARCPSINAKFATGSSSRFSTLAISDSRTAWPLAPCEIKMLLIRSLGETSFSISTNIAAPSLRSRPPG